MEAFYRELLDRYEVRIEWPEQTAASPGALPPTAAVPVDGSDARPDGE